MNIKRSRHQRPATSDRGGDVGLLAALIPVAPLDDADLLARDLCSGPTEVLRVVDCDRREDLDLARQADVSEHPTSHPCRPRSPRTSTGRIGEGREPIKRRSRRGQRCGPTRSTRWGYGATSLYTPHETLVVQRFAVASDPPR